MLFSWCWKIMQWVSTKKKKKRKNKLNLWFWGFILDCLIPKWWYIYTPMHGILGQIDVFSRKRRGYGRALSMNFPQSWQLEVMWIMGVTFPSCAHVYWYILDGKNFNFLTWAIITLKKGKRTRKWSSLWKLNEMEDFFFPLSVFIYFLKHMEMNSNSLYFYNYATHLNIIASLNWGGRKKEKEKKTNFKSV